MSADVAHAPQSPLIPGRVLGAGSRISAPVATGDSMPSAPGRPSRALAVAPFRQDQAATADEPRANWRGQPGSSPADGAAWTARDVGVYLQLGRTATYQLLRRPDAPAPLRTNGALRYDAGEVLAWLSSASSAEAKRPVVHVRPPSTTGAGDRPAAKQVRTADPLRRLATQREARLARLVRPAGSPVDGSPLPGGHDAAAAQVAAGPHRHPHRRALSTVPSDSKPAAIQASRRRDRHPVSNRAEERR